MNQYSDILKEYVEEYPASSITQTSNAIEKITGIKRSPAQIREFIRRIGLRCLKVRHMPGNSIEEGKIKEVEKI